MGELSDIVRTQGVGKRLVYTGLALLQTVSLYTKAIAGDLGEKLKPVKLVASKEKPLLAFISGRNGKKEIYVMNQDGSNERNISNNPRGGTTPLAWSYDGRRLANLTYNELTSVIVVTDVKSNTTRDYEIKLAGARHYIESMSWHPNGKLIFFADYYQGISKTVISKLNLESGGITEIVAGRDVAVSPNGTQIAVVTKVTERVTNDIYLINIDENGMPVAELNQNTRIPADGYNVSPAYSTDGTMLAYVHIDVKKGHLVDGTYRIRIIKTDGSGMNGMIEDEFKGFLPKISPDGSKLAYNTSENRLDYVNIFDLKTKTHNKRLAELVIYDDFNQHTWSADGTEIFFSNYSDINKKNVDIYAVNIENGSIRRLTTAEGFDAGAVAQLGYVVEETEEEKEVYPPWDVNQDGVVNIFDLIEVSRNFNKTVNPDSPVNPDVNRDGKVTILDLVQVASHFNETYKPVSASPPQRFPKSQDDIKAIKSAYRELMNQGYENYPDALDAMREIIEMSSAKGNQLLPIYPNPANPETWIPFKLEKGAHVEVSIWNNQGKEVRYMDIGYLQSGSYIRKSNAIYWDGKNQSGERVATGKYYATLRADNWSETTPIVILK